MSVVRPTLFLPLTHAHLLITELLRSYLEFGVYFLPPPLPLTKDCLFVYGRGIHIRFGSGVFRGTLRVPPQTSFRLIGTPPAFIFVRAKEIMMTKHLSYHFDGITAGLWRVQIVCTFDVLPVSIVNNAIVFPSLPIFRTTTTIKHILIWFIPFSFLISNRLDPCTLAMYQSATLPAISPRLQ